MTKMHDAKSSSYGRNVKSAVIIWVVMVSATALSWAIGSREIVGNVTNDHEVAGLFILLVTFIKVALIGLYFMDIRSAGRGLRALFGVYCSGAVILLMVFYVM